MKKTCFLLFLLLFSILYMVQAQQVIPLYDDSIPNSRTGPDVEQTEHQQNGHIILSQVSRPTLTVFLPEKGKATGMAVIICPGGGYKILAIGHEGYDVAKELNKNGITVFILKYRLPDDQTMINKEIGPLQDAQRAIQLVRMRAKGWGVDPARVGIMGFSAGGHLASTAGTHFDKPQIENRNGISLRPDFMILIYPVISFTDSISHHGSRDNLLGPNASAKKITAYSNELQVTSRTPRTFLVHAGDDQTVPVQNSVYFYEALQRSHVETEMHIFPKGGHGFGLHNPATKEEWIDLLRQWLSTL